MKSNKLIFFLLGWLLIYSCKKNDSTQITYPSIYHKSGVKADGDLRLFSSTGEVSDPAIVSRFNLTDSNFFTLYSNNILAYYFVMDSIYFQDPQRAIIVGIYGPKNCVVTHTRNRLNFTATSAFSTERTGVSG